MTDRRTSFPGGCSDENATASLPAAVLSDLRQAMQTIGAGRALDGAAPVARALAARPNHPDVLRVAAILDNAAGRHVEALDRLQRAHAGRPLDAPILIDLGNAQHGAGDTETAYASWRRACALAPDEPVGWFNIGRNLQLEGRTAEAVEALSEAIARAPRWLPALILRGDALVHLGDFDAAEADYRAAIWQHPACGDAWRGLANIKTRPLPVDDREQLSLNANRADVPASDRIAMRYALGKALEDAGEHADAFAVLSAANAELRSQGAWDASGFTQRVDALMAASEQLPQPRDRALGAEVIFIVGMPRSGSTLIEQILAAHPDVEGASELPDLPAVLDAESQRRGLPMEAWIADADAGDWHRLGHEYLERTAHWRQHCPRHTDKQPDNWMHAGVLRAMLPGAIIVDTRRDALETAWSCFRQQFYRVPHFSCDLVDVGTYLRDCERAMDHWRQGSPDRIRVQRYETLLATPDREITQLLEFCGLSFDERCMDFHTARRSVRTASASQVRQPLQRNTARAERYGALLQPLRDALALH